MRLVNVSTLESKVFVGRNIPPYCILSHTWGEDEVLCSDLQNGKAVAEKKAGFAKIEGCRKLTREKGVEWFWVDTCCIDRSSSAEVSEAVNCSYRWYQNAEACFAYLADVPAGDALEAPKSAFRCSRWFTRGWTLSELLAPKDVEFVDQTWSPLGSRQKQALAEIISSITAIPAYFLVHEPSLHPELDAPVALKLMWASKRQTTLEEDAAYSLLGLLRINMPVIYGEGEAAFTRLQEELVKIQYDQTLLAWGLYKGISSSHSDEQPPMRLHDRPPFARTLADFESWDMSIRPFPVSGPHYSATNVGLLIELPVLYLGAGTEVGLLDCGHPERRERVALPLEIVNREGHTALAWRSPGSMPFLLPSKYLDRARPMKMYLRDGEHHRTANGGRSWDGCHVRFDNLAAVGYRLADYFPGASFNLFKQQSKGPRTFGGLDESSESPVLLRFKNELADAEDILMLFWGQTADVNGAGPVPNCPMLGRWSVAVASGKDLPSTWRMVLQPNFDKVNFENIRKVFAWGPTVAVKTPGAVPLGSYQFKLEVGSEDVDARMSRSGKPFRRNLLNLVHIQ